MTRNKKIPSILLSSSEFEWQLFIFQPPALVFSALFRLKQSCESNLSWYALMSSSTHVSDNKDFYFTPAKHHTWN